MGIILIALKSFDDGVQLPLNSSVLIAGGRRERFLGTFVLMMIMGFIWMASIALSLAVLDFVQPYLPQIGTRTLVLKRGIPPVDVPLALFMTIFCPMFTLVNLALVGQWPRKHHVGVILSIFFLFSICALFAFERQLVGRHPLCLCTLRHRGLLGRLCL